MTNIIIDINSLVTKISNIRSSINDTSQIEEVNRFVDEIDHDWLRKVPCVEDQNT